MVVRVENMDDDTVSIQNTTSDLIPAVHALIVPENWNYGIHKVRLFCEADPEGSFCAINAKGEVVGHISLIRVGEDLATGGMVVVRPDYRGKGILRALLSRGDVFVGNRNKCADVEIAHKYHKTFSIRGYEIVTLSGFIDKTKVRKNFDINPDLKFVPVHDVDFQDILDYDTSIHNGIKRYAIVEKYLKNDAVKTLVALEAGTIVGYSSLVAVDVGHSIGPVYGESLAILESLFAKIVEQYLPDGELVYLLTENGHSFIPVLKEKAGLQEERRAVRWFSKRVVQLESSRKIGALLNDDLLC